MNPFKDLTREQLLRFDAFLNSLPLPRVTEITEKGIKVHEDDYIQYQKSLERLKLEDPELYKVCLKMKEFSERNTGK